MQTIFRRPPHQNVLSVLIKWYNCFLPKTVYRMDVRHFVIEWTLHPHIIRRMERIDAVIQIIVSIAIQSKMDMDVYIRAYHLHFKHQWCGMMAIVLIMVCQAMQRWAEHIPGKKKKHCLHIIVIACNNRNRKKPFEHNNRFRNRIRNWFSLSAIFFCVSFDLMLDVICNVITIAKWCQMDYNSIHLEVVVCRRVWRMHPRSTVLNAIAAEIIGDRAVFGIQIVRFRWLNKLQHPFSQNKSTLAIRMNNRTIFVRARIFFCLVASRKRNKIRHAFNKRRRFI